MSYSSEFESASESYNYGESFEEPASSSTSVRESPSTSISLPSTGRSGSTAESIQTVIETPATLCKSRQSVASRTQRTQNTHSPVTNYQDESFETLSPTDNVGIYSSSFESPDATARSPDVMDLYGEEARQEFLVKKLKLLHMEQPKEKSLSSRKGTSLDKAERSFIKEKIKQLKQDMREDLTVHKKIDKSKASSRKVKSTDDLPTLFGSALQRLKAENFLHDLKKASSAWIHDPLTCQSCQKQNEETSRRDFLKQKISVIQNKEIQEKMEEHLYLRDPLTLIGNIMKDLPTLQDSPEDVWARLNKPLTQRKENP